MAMLSKEEAVYFVSHVLEISSPLEKIAQDSYHFLKEYMSAFHVNIPFQTITSMAIEPHLRHRPSIENIKESVMSKKGGRCYTLNTFNKFLLEALGYDSYFVGSDIFKPNNHLVVVVENLKTPGDKYIVDVGIGVPNFEPISLNFEESSPVYSQSFSQFKYVRKDGKLTRYHKKNSAPLAPPNMAAGEVEWRPFYVIVDDQLPRKEHSYFDDIMEEIYTDNDCAITPFSKSFRAVAYRRDGADLKLVAIKESTLLLENASHCIEEVKLESVDEILEKVDLYYPHLSDAARKAVKNTEFRF